MTPDNLLRDFEDMRVRSMFASKGNGKVADPAIAIENGYITLSDLYDRPDPAYRFVVDGLLPAGGSSLLVAKPKVGKSTLAQQIARDIAAGAPCLGRPTQQGAVLYHAFEDKDTEIKLAFLRAGAPRDLPILFYFDDMPDDQVGALRAAIERFSPVFVVIDTLAYWMRVQDFNDYSQVSAAMRPLHRLARTTGCHIMAIHHAGKGSSANIDSPLGSTALAANVDTIAVIEETEQGRTFQTKQRIGEAWPATVLAFDKESTYVSVSGSVVEATRRNWDQTILRACASTFRTVNELEQRLEIRRSSLLERLDHLTEIGLLCQDGTGTPKNPRRYMTVRR